MVTHSSIIQSLRSLYQSQIDALVIDIHVLTSNPSSIPEHTSFIDAVDGKVSELASIMDKLEALKLL
jgi:hypothetical protein